MSVAQLTVRPTPAKEIHLRRKGERGQKWDSEEETILKDLNNRYPFQNNPKQKIMDDDGERLGRIEIFKKRLLKRGYERTHEQIINRINNQKRKVDRNLQEKPTRRAKNQVRDLQSERDQCSDKIRSHEDKLAAAKKKIDNQERELEARDDLKYTM